MYSLVMMMAMNGPVAEAPSFWWRHGCTGCSGCSGACYGGCHGHGIFGHHHHACCGGGCCGGGCCGGYAACSGYGCYGAGLAHACGGCVGCMGYGFAGCYGSCYGSYTNYFSYWTQPPTTYGYGTPMYPEPAPATVPPVNPPIPVKPVPPVVPAPGKAPETISYGNPASVTIQLPADATLYANGIRTSQKSEERKFVTPAMEPNQRYHYIFTAEIERDGQVVTETKKVEVWSGARVAVDFGTMSTAKSRQDSSPTLVISPQ